MSENLFAVLAALKEPGTAPEIHARANAAGINLGTVKNTNHLLTRLLTMKRVGKVWEGSKRAFIYSLKPSTH